MSRTRGGGWRRPAAFAAALSVAMLCGCGSTTTTVLVNHVAPKAQEARDLRRALDSGLLSPQEYQQQRIKLGL